MKGWTVFCLGLVALLLAGCTASPYKSNLNESNNQSVNGSVNATLNQTNPQEIAHDWLVRRAPTYVFDGIPETLRLVDNGTHREPAMGRPCRAGEECWQACYPQACWTFTYAFESRQGGFGNRSGMMLTQVITPHQTEIWVDPQKMSVIFAVTDGVFDERSGQKMVLAT